MKLTSIIALFLIFIGISSCITIEESYSFNADGSGTMSYSFDYSEFASLMESMNSVPDEELTGEETTDNEVVEDEPIEDPMADVREMLNSKIAILEAIDGISNVKFSEKVKNVVTISYQFKDLQALNKAINKLTSEDEQSNKEHFTSKGKTLKHTTLLGDLQKSLTGEDEDDAESKEMMEMFLEQMHYKFNMTFEKPVKSVKSEEYGDLASDKKSYSMDVDFKKLLENPKALDIEVKR